MGKRIGLIKGLTTINGGEEFVRGEYNTQASDDLWFEEQVLDELVVSSNVRGVGS